MLKIREKVKIKLGHKRFALRHFIESDQYQDPSMHYLVDRDAETNGDDRVVAIVAPEYAKALCDLLNQEDSQLFNLRPAKRKAYSLTYAKGAKDLFRKLNR